MSKNRIIFGMVVIMSLVYMSGASATTFWVSGKINKILAGQYYGGCMLYLDKSIGNNCPANGWVSLDCKGLFNDKSIETGKKKFASALAAAQSGKSIGMVVNDLNKVNGYCVASRVDVYY